VAVTCAVRHLTQVATFLDLACKQGVVGSSPIISTTTTTTTTTQVSAHEQRDGLDPLASRV